MIHNFSGIRDFHARDGDGCQEFLLGFFLSQSNKTFVGKIFCVKKECVIESFIGKMSIQRVL